MFQFTEEQLQRYSRHILLKEIGIEGQIKIMHGKVLIIGAGGLGSPAALYLAAAGVGKIGIVDFDKVELSNLQRQIIHFTNNINMLKVDSASEKLRLINPDIEVKTYNVRVCAGNIREKIRGWDFVIDGTDNFAAKYLINDACYFEGIPHSHGGILRFEGQTITIVPGESACFRCVSPKPPPKNAIPSCSEAGVLGVVAGILGTIQAAEALKFLVGNCTLLTDRMLIFDALDMEFRKMKLTKRTDCVLCGKSPKITELFDEEPIECDLSDG